MALIDCGECGRMASDQAAACPHCGAPVAPSPVSPQLAYADLAVAPRSVGFWLGLGIFLLPMIFAWLLLRQGITTPPQPDRCNALHASTTMRQAAVSPALVRSRLDTFAH